jgi:Na+-transporting NADH:ubiquinone oxidoreductase subunit NqrB
MSAIAEEIIPQPKPVNKIFGIDERFIAPLLITFILLVGQLTFGILESYPKTLLAISVSILTEVILGKIFLGRIPFLSSAYISGISVGILVRSPEYWAYALCAMLATSSKYVLRVKDRHIWNPSNFAISAMLFLAPYTVASLSIQWGNNLYAMAIIWMLGCVIIYRLGRFHITLTYVLSFFILSLVRSYITGHSYFAEIAPITGPMYQLFIFFMITDPPTTVRSSKYAQCFVVFLVALVEMFLRLFENVHAPYYALFTVGPIANLVEIWWQSRKQAVVEV